MSDQYKCSVCGKVMTLDDTMRHDHHDVNNHYELLSEADTLRAENAKLREALKSIEKYAENSIKYGDGKLISQILMPTIQEALKNE